MVPPIQCRSYVGLPSLDGHLPADLSGKEARLAQISRAPAPSDLDLSLIEVSKPVSNRRPCQFIRSLRSSYLFALPCSPRWADLDQTLRTSSSHDANEKLGNFENIKSSGFPRFPLQPSSSQSLNRLLLQASAELSKMFSTISVLALALAAQAAPLTNVIGSMYIRFLS